MDKIINDFSNVKGSKDRIEILKRLCEELNYYERTIVKNHLNSATNGNFDILGGLVPELVDEVLKYFTTDELLGLRFVCRKWYQLVDHSCYIRGRLKRIKSEESNGNIAEYNKQKRWENATPMKWRNEMGNCSSTGNNGGDGFYYKRKLEMLREGERIKHVCLKEKYMLVGYNTTKIRVYELKKERGVMQKRLEKISNTPIYSDICEKAKVVVVVCFCREVRVYSIETGETKYESIVESVAVSAVSISGDILVIGKCNGVVELVDWRNKKRIKSLKMFEEEEVRATGLVEIGGAAKGVTTIDVVAVSLTTLKIQQLKNGLHEMESYSKTLPITPTIGPPSLGIWQLSGAVGSYLILIQFKGICVRYQKINNIQKIEFIYTGMLGSYCVYPYRIISPLNINKDSLSIHTIGSTIEPIKNYGSVLEINEPIVLARCNDRFLVVVTDQGKNLQYYVF